ncbi:MAG: helicase [Chlamydiae bacterium RIFCSPHIGHO2_12_FULL_27_8]|nr:MAG: helicase [Chlamydiae bacterium RIFCSPHIGHO2_12_FULL_27_8]
MYKVIGISPGGCLRLFSFRDGEYSHQTIHNNKIVDHFFLNPNQGLLFLAGLQEIKDLPSSLNFWRDFAASYFKALCHLSSEIEDIFPPLEEFEQLVLSIPPMPGAEYCSIEVLKQIWQALNGWVRLKIQTFPDGIKGFISCYLPLWSKVGRVCFHLAENKHNLDYPFAFLATYAPKLSKNAKVLYQPLSKALEQYAGEKNNKALAHLLKPIYEASKQCWWVQDLIDSGDIYHALAWKINEAHLFLKDADKLYESGVLIHFPNWWKKRPRPKVQVTIGNKKQNAFGKESLLDFDIGIALNGELLTQEELSTIYSAEDGLISLRGQWIEVDKEKLNEALSHWKVLKNDMADGVSFIEGMRLLSGTKADLSGTEELGDQAKNWAYVEPSQWLKDILKNLKNPESITFNNKSDSLKTTLRSYQQVGVNWLMLLTELGLGACLADDMGLGKTIQVLALLLAKKEQKKEKHYLSLLILPASLLSNWKMELEKFAPSLKAIYLHGSEMPKNLLENAFSNQDLKKTDIILTTYGMLLRLPSLKNIFWDLIIIDEAQAIKNPGTRQTKAIKELKSFTRIALTGTPIENRLGDLWSLFDFLCPGLLGSADRFNQFTKTLDQQDHAYGPLRKLVQPYILRRLKTDKQIINDLPDKTEMTGWCSLTKDQAKLYAKAVNELKETLQKVDGIKRRGIILSCLMKFKQICNHPSQYLGNNEYKTEQSGKFARLQEICEEIASRQEKVLLFTQFREITLPLESLLQEIFNRQGLILHGGTPVKQRKNLVDSFQKEQGPPFFILSLKAAGVGLNLTAANHVIHFDRWWNPAVENQATDRAFRIGQHKNVLVHKFICRGTVEEKIDQMILDKISLAEGILKNDGVPKLTEMTDENLLDLVSLDIEKAIF